MSYPASSDLSAFEEDKSAAGHTRVSTRRRRRKELVEVEGPVEKRSLALLHLFLLSDEASKSLRLCTKQKKRKERRKKGEKKKKGVVLNMGLACLSLEEKKKKRAH